MTSVALQFAVYRTIHASLHPNIVSVFRISFSYPTGFNFFDMYMDTKSRKLKTWAEIIPEFIYDSNKPFFETLVPTIDTVRYGYMFEKLLGVKKPVMFTGNTGTLHNYYVSFVCRKRITVITFL